MSLIAEYSNIKGAYQLSVKELAEAQEAHDGTLARWKEAQTAWLLAKMELTLEQSPRVMARLFPKLRFYGWQRFLGVVQIRVLLPTESAWIKAEGDLSPGEELLLVMLQKDIYSHNTWPWKLFDRQLCRNAAMFDPEARKDIVAYLAKRRGDGKELYRLEKEARDARVWERCEEKRAQLGRWKASLEQPLRLSDYLLFRVAGERARRKEEAWLLEREERELKAQQPPRPQKTFQELEEAKAHELKRLAELYGITFDAADAADAATFATAYATAASETDGQQSAA